MSSRPLGSVLLPDIGREEPLLMVAGAARAGLAARGTELWPRVAIALSELSPKVGSQAIFVAGSGEREAVLVATALALGAAASGRSTVLVDPGGLAIRLGSGSGGAGAAGFAELAAGGAAADSMRDTGIAGLTLVPAGRAAGGLAAARPSAEELREALDVLRAHGEIVLVPGVIWQGDDASALLSLADAFVVVRRAGRGAAGDEDLPDLGAPRALTGLNAVRLGTIEATLPGAELESPAPPASRRLYDARGVARNEAEVEEEEAAEAAEAAAAAAKVAAPKVAAAKAAGEARRETGREGSSRGRLLLIGGAALVLIVAGATVALLHPELTGRARRAPVPADAGGAAADSGGAREEWTSISGEELAARDRAAESLKTAQAAVAGVVGVAESAAAPGPAMARVDSGAAGPGVPAPAKREGGFAVIVASFKVRGNAEKTADALRREGHSPAVWVEERPGMGRWYRVIADTMASRAAADSLAASFRKGDKWRDAMVAVCE